MRYILLGKLDPEWAGRQRERVSAAREKAKELGIEIQAVYYTHGPYDFIALTSASDPYVVEAFALWYLKKKFGRIEASPALDESAMADAVDRI
jgi:uncharacterized protein with GYD domain